MARWIYEEIEQLSREAKELLSPNIHRRWNKDTSEYENTLTLKCELPSLNGNDINRLQEDLGHALRKTLKKYIRRRKEKISRRLKKL